MKIHGAEDGVEQADDEPDRIVRRDPRVLSEPVLGVLVLSDREPELAEAIIGQPPIDEKLREPRAPATLDRHARPDGKDRYNNADARERQKRQRLAAKRLLVTAGRRHRRSRDPRSSIDTEWQAEAGRSPGATRSAAMLGRSRDALPESRSGAPEARQEQSLSVRRTWFRIEP